MKLRRAEPSDIEGLAYVSVETWKTTYAGLISDAFLSTLTVEGRKEIWDRSFKNLNIDEVTFVLADNEDRLIGFVKGGRCRESNCDSAAEVYSIYILKEFQGSGYGKLLFKEMVEHLIGSHYHTLKVWVLEGNPAVHFYTNLGGQIVGKKEIKIGEETLIELAVQWKDIKDIR